MKWKKLFAEEFEKIKIETNKMMEELKSISAMLQKYVKNLTRLNEELQKMRRTGTILSKFMSKNKVFNEKNKRRCKWCIKSGTWSF